MKPAKPPDILYHGSAERNIKSIKKKGLLKMNRQYVHLSEDKNTALKVGMRHGKPVVLKIKSKEMHKNSLLFYLSENKLWLTEKVELQYIIFQK